MDREEYVSLLVALSSLGLTIWAGVVYIGFWAALIWFGAGLLSVLVAYMVHEEWPHFNDVPAIVHDSAFGVSGLYESFFDLSLYIRWRYQRGFLLWQCFTVLALILCTEAAVAYWLFQLSPWALLGAWGVIVIVVLVLAEFMNWDGWASFPSDFAIAALAWLLYPFALSFLLSEPTDKFLEQQRQSMLRRPHSTWGVI